MKELKFTLTTSSGALLLPVSPDGWDESLISWDRSDKYWGVFRSFTIPLKFVKSGATELRNEFYLRGTAGVASIVIERLNKATLLYSIAFSGICDLGTFKDSDNYAEVNLVDYGIAFDFKNNSGTEYSIPPWQIWLRGFAVKAPYTTSYGCDTLKNIANALLDKITGGKITTGEYLFQSDVLDSIDPNRDGTIDGDRSIMLTSGFNLRTPGISYPENILKTTFDDFFKSINTFLCVGIGIEIDPATGKSRIRIERKSYFFDLITAAIDLGETKTINFSINNKLSYNILKIGFPPKEYTNFINSQEPNATSQWMLPNGTSSEELDLVSKYRGDSLGVIEIINTATDSGDEDLYFIETVKSGFDNILGFDTNARQTGQLPEWWVGNGSLSPRTCLLANLAFIRSLFWNYVGDKIDFTSGDNDLYNIELKVHGVAPFVPERDPVMIGNPVYFIPFTFEIECALPVDLIDQLNSNSTRMAMFSYRGYPYYGWIMEAKVKLSGRGSGKIKLLALPPTVYTLHTLIR